MFPLTRLVFTALVICFFGVQCAKQEPLSQPCKTCAAARRANGWCEVCEVGYVGGAAIKSKLLFETMDAHGHELAIDQLKCEVCRRAAARDGYCEACHIGWVGGMAYFSRLTYELGNGEYREVDEIACEVCRKNAAGAGWCQKCGIGMIGRFAIAERADFDAGLRDYERMCRAIELSKRCDHCAMAAATDTACFPCKKNYVNGFAVETAAAKP